MSGNEGKPHDVKEESREEPPKDELLRSIVHPRCDLCGSLMREFHCRLVCPMCGYERDCSDP